MSNGSFKYVTSVNNGFTLDSKPRSMVLKCEMKSEDKTEVTVYFLKIMASTKPAVLCVFGRYTRNCFPNAQNVGATNSGTLTLPSCHGLPE